MKLRPPSPALTISIVALVAACAGSAVAATLITSADIRNGTIRGVDIRSGTITSSKLSKGTQDLLKRRSAATAAGGTVAFETIRKSGPENQPANVQVKLASLNVPPGAYVVQANTILTAFTGTTNPIEALLGASGSLSGVCSLDAGGPRHSAAGTIVVNDRQTPATLSMQLTRTVGAPTEFFVQCAASAPWRASETSIIATKVDSVTLSEVAP